MTDQKTTDAPQNQISEQQIQLLRSSLISTAFGKYTELVNILKSLPVNQNIPGVVQAYLFIDSGMLWFKEILNSAPLIFSTAPAPSAPEQAPNVDEKKEEEKPAEVIPDNA